MQNLTRLNEKGKKVVFARAYERERPQSSKVADQEVAWTERVQVIRSLELAKRQAKQLDERLCEATAALQDLTPPVGRGHKQYREEEALRAAVAAILEQHRVEGLLTVIWEREEQQQTRYRGSGRGGPGRPTYTTTKVRYVGHGGPAERSGDRTDESSSRLAGASDQSAYLALEPARSRSCCTTAAGAWSVTFTS